MGVRHSGTELLDGKLVTNGGRVMAITGIGENKDNLRQVVYSKMKEIKFAGKHYRNDIGFTEVRSK